MCCFFPHDHCVSAQLFLGVGCKISASISWRRGQILHSFTSTVQLVMLQLKEFAAKPVFAASSQLSARPR